MSKLTTKLNQLSLRKHTHSSNLSGMKENLLMPMLMEGFVEGAGGSKRWQWELLGVGKAGALGLLVQSCGS